MAPVQPFQIIRKNVPRKMRKDLYHDLLSMSWKKTVCYFGVFFLTVNSIFATLYWLQPGSLHNSDNSWPTCFFFSVQTLATIGYGFLAPATLQANILVTIEAVLGLFIIAILTGLFFAKFSKAFAKVEFTDKMIITQFDGKTTLIFRMINLRANQIVDSTINLTLLKEEVTIEGHELRRFHELKLVRTSIPLLAMSINIMHVIDESSPLFALGKEGCFACNAEFLVTLIGTDGTFGQTIHATHVYRAEDIAWNRNFKDIVKVLPDRTREVDFGNFNELN